MNTANLRVKFVPFIKKDTKDSLLEIVPQVSCVDNLNEIKVQDNKDQLEFIVPVTYRITITKRSEIVKEEVGSRKAYYSCIDLPFQSELDLGKGDLPRHTSENLVYEQAHSSDYDVFLKEIRKIFADYRSHMFRHKKFNQEALQLPKLSQAIGDVKSDKSTITLNKEASADTLRRLFYRDIVYTTEDNNSAVWPDVEKLTLTPICLIAAEDSCSKSIDFNYIAHQSSIDASLFFPFSRSTENEREYAYSLAYMKCGLAVNNEDVKVWKKNKSRNLDSRIQNAYKNNFLNKIETQTQIKIAEFKNYIQQEMLPLKIKFNDILKNCKVNGIKHAVCDREDVVPAIESNRVAYTIVFKEK